MEENRNVEIEICGTELEKVLPDTVAISEKAWNQLLSLQKIFNKKDVGPDAEIFLGASSPQNNIYAKVYPRCVLYSVKSGLHTGELKATKKLPGDLTTLVNEVIGELYEKVHSRGNVILIGVDEDGGDDPKGFAVVSGEKLHFGFE